MSKIIVEESAHDVFQFNKALVTSLDDMGYVIEDMFAYFKLDQTTTRSSMCGRRRSWLTAFACYTGTCKPSWLSYEQSKHASY